MSGEAVVVYRSAGQTTTRYFSEAGYTDVTEFHDEAPAEVPVADDVPAPPAEEVPA